MKYLGGNAWMPCARNRTLTEKSCANDDLKL